MKPFIKWVGGKTQLLPELRKRVPESFSGNYFEPFVGGGALFFGYDHFPLDATLGDVNYALMNTYIVLRDRPSHLIVALNKLAARYNAGAQQEATYYAIRSLFNDEYGGDNDVTAAARLIFLNKTCFNGLYRVNKKGGFNVPWGSYESFTPDEAVLTACSNALKCAKLVCGDYETIVFSAKRGDFVYFDPPYVPVSATSNFAAYQKEGFGPVEQERLRNCAADLKSRGVNVLLSNSDVPFVRNLYRFGFNIERVEARRAVNSDPAKRGKVGEVLIT